MKTRLLFNSARAWKGIWSIPIILLLSIVWGFGIANSTEKLFSFIMHLNYGEESRWLFALVLLYALLLILTSDLIMGHTLNLCQMSTDLPHLLSLPVSPIAIFGVKMYERFLSDWMGILILGSSFIGVTCREGITGWGILVALVIYFQLEVLLGMFLTLASVMLQRIARPSTVNNAFSLLGYLSAFVGLVPYILVSNKPKETFGWILDNFGRFEGFAGKVLMPLRLIVDSLIDVSLGTSFIRWSFIWGCLVIAASAAFSLFHQWQWLTFVHPGAKHGVVKGSIWLSGFIRKETLLMKSDFNILTNSLFMPLSIIVMEIMILKELITVSNLSHAMNMMAAAAMYFCLFGPINAVGSEGQSISMLESLPIHPHTILRKKAVFWIIVAEAFFIPAAMGVGWYLKLSLEARMILPFWTAMMTAAFVWVSVSMSAIYAKYEGKVLQQRSTLTGKMLAALAMGVAIPVKDFSANSFVAAMVFIFLGISLQMKAAETLENRLDPAQILSPEYKAHDAFLIILVIMGVQRFVAAVVSVLPSEPSLVWPWLISYVFSMVILLRTTWSYTRDRFPSVPQALGLSKLGGGWLWAGIVIALPMAFLVGRTYLELLDRNGVEIFSQDAQVWNAAVALFGHSWALVIMIIVFCILAPLVEEAFFRGFFDRALLNLGWKRAWSLAVNGFFFAMLHPPISMPIVFLLGIMCAMLLRRSGSLWPGIALHAIYNAGILYVHSCHL